MINFGIIDLIDIVSVACILYYIYQLMKKSSSANIFYGILVFIVVWLLVTQVFEMRLLGGIMNNMVNVGALALIILFKRKSAISFQASVRAAAPTCSSACFQGNARTT